MTVDLKKLVSEGCSEIAAWRCSDMLRHDGQVRVDLASEGGWAHKMMGTSRCDAKWRSAVITLVEQWRTDNDWRTDTVWRWDPTHILEHDYLAQVSPTGEVSLCQVLRTEHNERNSATLDTATRTVQVRWLTRQSRSQMVDHNTEVKQLMLWLQYRGGWGQGTRTRNNDRAPHQEWVWTTTEDDCDYVALSTLSPVTVSEVDVLDTWRISGHGVLVVVDEPHEWWLQAQWEIPTGAWAFPKHRVVGEQFSNSKVQRSQVLKAQQAWWKTLQVQATTAASLPANVLYSYSDCSLIRKAGYIVVSYGWVTAGVANRHLVREVGTEGSGRWRLDPAQSAWDLETLEKGTWGGGVVDGPQEDHSTFRGEAFGLLAVLVWLYYSEWQGRLDHRLDNEAVVHKYNRDDTLYTDYEKAVYADPDVWAAIYKLKHLLGVRVQVGWQRSHPERRLSRAMWNRHDRGNDWSDSRADRALESFTPTHQRLQLVDPEEQGWGVSWLGQLVVCDIRRVMSAALKVTAIKRYFTVNREWDDATVQMLSPDRWVGRLAQMRAAASATVVNKMLFGWLATMTVKARRGDREALLTTQCRLGCACEETNWHVLAECKHPEVVAERRRCVAEVHKLIDTLPVSPLARKVLGISWALDDSGCVRERTSLEGMQEVMQGWAPELVAATAAIQEDLCWHQPQGTHHDDLWKLSFKGLMLDHWVAVLAEMDVERPQATAMLLKVETTIAAALPEVWNVFSQESHQQGGAKERRRELDTQIRDMLAKLAGAGKALSIQRERVLGKSTAREKRKWLHKKRKLQLPEERYTQRTLRQCGMGESEPLTHERKAQLTQHEITRRAVARMTLDEWHAWMKLEGEQLPPTSVLGRQAEVRACQLLAAEGMGLEAMDDLGNDWLGEDCDEGSVIPRAHEPCPIILLGESLDTTEAARPLHVPQAAAVTHDGMQAGSDDTDARVPAGEPGVRGSAGAAHGGGGHLSVRSDTEGVSREGSQEDTDAARRTDPSSRCVLGLGGTGEHSRVAAAYRRQTTAGQRSASGGVEGAGGGGGRLGRPALHGGCTLVCNLQDEGTAAAAPADGGTSTTGDAGAGTARVDAQREVTDEAGRYGQAEPQRLQCSTGPAAPTERDCAGGVGSQAALEKADGSSDAGNCGVRSSAEGLQGSGSSGRHQGDTSEGCGDRPVCRQAINEGPSTEAQVQVCGGGHREGLHCDQGIAEDGCGTGPAAGVVSGAGAGDSQPGRSAGVRDPADMGICPMPHSQQAGPRQSKQNKEGRRAIHRPQRVLSEGGCEVPAGGSGGGGRHQGTTDGTGREGRRHTRNCAAGAGRCFQSLRNTLCSGESNGPIGEEAGNTSSATQHQATLPQAQLLPVQAQVCEGHQRLDDGGRLESKGRKRHRYVQGSNRLLQRSLLPRQGLQEADRGGQSRHRTLEPHQRHWRTGVEGRQGLIQGRTAEQGACPATAGNTTGDVDEGTGQVQNATEDDMEAMHRRCVQADTHRRCVRVASSRKNSEKQDLLPD